MGEHTYHLYTGPAYFIVEVFHVNAVINSVCRHLMPLYFLLITLQTILIVGIATNVSVELHVASLGSINTENMVTILAYAYLISF